MNSHETRRWYWQVVSLDERDSFVILASGATETEAAAKKIAGEALVREEGQQAETWEEDCVALEPGVFDWRPAFDDSVGTHVGIRWGDDDYVEWGE